MLALLTPFCPRESVVLKWRYFVCLYISGIDAHLLSKLL
jgi:hypothetical protein